MGKIQRLNLDPIPKTDVDREAVLIDPILRIFAKCLVRRDREPSAVYHGGVAML